MTTARIAIGGYAPQETSHGAALAHLAERLRELTDGAVEVDVTWNILDAERPATDLFDMVASGELTLCYFSSSYLGHRVPDLNVLDVPFLFEDLDQAHRALDGELGEALTRATRAATPYDVLGYWDNGFRHLTNRVRPVRTPADCAGMRVRLQPNDLHAAMVEAWGAIPVPTELSAGIAMIVAHEVEAQENPLANTVAYGVDRHHGHVTMSAHLYGARGLYANADTVAELPSGVREALHVAAREAVVLQRGLAARHEDELRARLEQLGLAFVDLTPEERAGFVAATAPVVDAALGRFDDGLLRMVRRA